jgi:hypothetical protein
MIAPNSRGSRWIDNFQQPAFIIGGSIDLNVNGDAVENDLPA